MILHPRAPAPSRCVFSAAAVREVATNSQAHESANKKTHAITVQRVRVANNLYFVLNGQV